MEMITPSVRPLDREVRNGTPAAVAPKLAPLTDAGRRAGQEEGSRIAQRLFASGEGVRAAVFAAAESGSGTTYVAANVARAMMRHVSGRVCIVDANLRNPALHRIFGIDGAAIGLADCVDGVVPAAVARQVETGLWVVSAGHGEAASQGSGRIKQLLAGLRAEFDYLIVDAPALDLYSDAIDFGHIADGVVLVLASAVTRKDAAWKAKAELASAHVPVLGAVLNKRTYPVPEALYRRL